VGIKLLWFSYVFLNWIISLHALFIFSHHIPWWWCCRVGSHCFSIVFLMALGSGLANPHVINKSGHVPLGLLHIAANSCKWLHIVANETHFKDRKLEGCLQITCNSKERHAEVEHSVKQCGSSHLISVSAHARCSFSGRPACSLGLPNETL
jgi:hypothetical protein